MCLLCMFWDCHTIVTRVIFEFLLSHTIEGFPWQGRADLSQMLFAWAHRLHVALLKEPHSRCSLVLWMFVVHFFIRICLMSISTDCRQRLLNLMPFPCTSSTSERSTTIKSMRRSSVATSKPCVIKEMWKIWLVWPSIRFRVGGFCLCVSVRFQTFEADTVVNGRYYTRKKTLRGTMNLQIICGSWPLIPLVSPRSPNPFAMSIGDTCCSFNASKFYVGLSAEVITYLFEGRLRESPAFECFPAFTTSPTTP